MMQSDPKLADRAAIIELHAYFAWLIDHKDGHGVPELFTADGRYGYEGCWCEGTEEIEDFYERRRRPGTRKSRHVLTNSWVTFERDDIALSQSILVLFATDGDPEDSASPISILDYSDKLLRQADDTWRYQERSVSPVFGHMPRLMEKELSEGALSPARMADGPGVRPVAKAL